MDIFIITWLSCVTLSNNEWSVKQHQKRFEVRAEAQRFFDGVNKIRTCPDWMPKPVVYTAKKKDVDEILEKQRLERESKELAEEERAADKEKEKEPEGGKP